jgi:hypothetical protein
MHRMTQNLCWELNTPDGTHSAHGMQEPEPEPYVKILFRPMLPDIRKTTALFACPQALPVCPSDKSSIKIKQSMGHQWNNNDRRKSK